MAPMLQLKYVRSHGSCKQNAHCLCQLKTVQDVTLQLAVFIFLFIYFKPTSDKDDLTQAAFLGF